MSTLRTDQVACGDAGAMDMHVWTPDQPPRAAILVIQEIFGVGPYIRAVAERLADAGYLVGAPDVFWRFARNWEADHDQAGLTASIEKVQQMDPQQAVADCVAAMQHLAGQAGIEKVGALGYCLGGTLSWGVAAAAEPAVCVSYYGSGVPGMMGLIDQVDCPTLFHFGNQDAYIPNEGVDAIAAAIADRPGFVLNVESAGHAFDNHESDMFYNEAAAKAAWSKTMAFLAEHMPAWNAMAYEDGVIEGRLTVRDGRTIAWTEHGPADGTPLLRMPGTPGSRWSLGSGDRDRYHRRGLRVITTERPGFGASTRLPGHGFLEPVDDYAELLDHLDIDRVLTTGGSGGAPYVLAFLARHPDRARAATIEVGAAPITADEAQHLVEINRRGWELAHDGDWDAMCEFIRPIWESIVADPVGGLRAAVADASADDLEAMADEEWQAAATKGIYEALNGNMEGWVDEGMAMETRWDEIDFSAITTSITWWHSRDDAMSVFSAVERLVARLPTATLREMTGQGHIGADYAEPILDDLLARG